MSSVDYIVNMYICDEDDPTTEEDESEVCNKNLVAGLRPIGGQCWVHDATPMLAWLGDGGTRKFAFYSQQPYNVSLDLRFSNQDKGERPFAIEDVYRGGGLDDFTYNWGSYHNLTETEWRQWTIEEQQDVFTIQSTEQVEDNRDFMFIYGTIQWQRYETALDENGWDWLDIATIVVHNETEQFWITEDNNDPDLEENIVLITPGQEIPNVHSPSV